MNEELVGRLAYMAIAEYEPSGKALTECQRVPVSLRFFIPEDLVVAQHSLADLRRERIIRLTHDAFEQGGTLTLEELALLLTSSLSTIVRDIRQLRMQGEIIPTRGQNKDIGRSFEGRLKIVKMYVSGMDMESIGESLQRSVDDVKRPIERFLEVKQLLERKMPLDKVAQIVKISPGLVHAYAEFLASCEDDQET